MKFIDLIRLSLTNLKGNRLRTILTVMGVGIGIGAIVFLVTLGLGLQKLTIEKITQSAALTTLDVNIGSSTILKLNDESVKEIKNISHIESVSALISSSGQVSYNETTTDCAIRGVDKNTIEWENLKFDPEKIISPLSNKDNFPSVVVTSGMLKLFEIKNEDEMLGKELTFHIYIPADNNESGELKKETKIFLLADIIEDETPIAYIDVTELKNLGITNYSSLKVKVDAAENLNSVKGIITQKGFSVTSIADLVSQIQKAFRVIEAVLGGFGVIALLVSAIGMFNTMTIALLERTRDIGIMKAIGARKKDIGKLFILEATLIGFLGGIVGVLGGWLLSVGVNIFINSLASRAGGEQVQLFSTPIMFVLGIIVFALFVGLITGIYPARRAAKINPLEALRYE